MTDERDIIDPSLDRAWRAHVRDTPPESLDRAILAAAHRAVGSAPAAASHASQSATPRWRKWAPLAVAASLGAIALGVVQLMPREHDATQEIVSDGATVPSQKQAPAEGSAPAASQPGASPPAASPSVASPPAGAPKPAPHLPRAQIAAPHTEAAPHTQTLRDDAASRERASVAAQVGANATATERRESVLQPLAKPVPPVLPAPTAPQAFVPEPPPAAQAQRGAPVDKVVPAPAESASSPRSVGRTAAAAARAPDDFIREIERLRNEGRDADAALALSAFRAAYPDADARLPSSLRDWARSVAQP